MWNIYLGDTRIFLTKKLVKFKGKKTILYFAIDFLTHKILTYRIYP